MPYRDPQQCERMECLDADADLCLDHLKGFYLKERGCEDSDSGGKMVCTDCTYGHANTLTAPTDEMKKYNEHPNILANQYTSCKCEKTLFQRVANYNDRCDSKRACSVGECFRPCTLYLHVSTCPNGRCMWNTTTDACQDAPDGGSTMFW